MSKVRSFKEYIDSRFDGVIYEELNVYIDSHKNLMAEKTNIVDKIDEAELFDIEIKSTSVENDKDWKIKFDVIVATTILLKGHHHSDEQVDDINQWFLLECRGDLSKNLNNFHILKIEEYTSKTIKTSPLSDCLVPLIKKENYDKKATQILEKFYPEALRRPVKLDPEELVRRIGLNVLQRTTSSDRSIFGQIFFCEL